MILVLDLTAKFVKALHHLLLLPAGCTLDRVVDAVQTFEEADILRDGKINPEEWQAFVQKNPSIINYMTLPVLRQLTDKYPSFRDIDMM